MSIITRIKEQHIATYAILALAIPLMGLSHLSASTEAAPLHPLWPYEPQLATITMESCVTGEPVCNCVRRRARDHIPLPKDHDLANPLIVDEMLEDAYFKGTLDTKLSALEASAPKQNGRDRDAALANIRDMRIRAAKRVAGTCLTDFLITDMRSYHASGLAKSSIKAMIAREFERAQAQRGDMTKLAVNLRDAAP